MIYSRPQPLPRYFPPGYLDRSFYVTVAVNVCTTAWCAAFTWLMIGHGTSRAALAVTAASLGVCIAHAIRFAGMTYRHSREWRECDRPRYEAMHAEIDRLYGSIETQLDGLTEKTKNEKIRKN